MLPCQIPRSPARNENLCNIILYNIYNIYYIKKYNIIISLRTTSKVPTLGSLSTNEEKGAGGGGIGQGAGGG